jgi:hypothetical protein
MTRAKPVARTVSAAANAIFNPRGRSHSTRERSAPAAAAPWGSKWSPGSTRAAASPVSVVAASAESATEKRPEDARPDISTSAPRGSPPPRRRSSPSHPVGR